MDIVFSDTIIPLSKVKNLHPSRKTVFSPSSVFVREPKDENNALMDNRYREVYRWLSENCVDAYEVVNDGYGHVFVFENVRDAAMFKLKFS